MIPDTVSFRRCAGFSDRPVAQSAVILDGERHRYFGVNGPGAAIWRLLERPATFGGIVAALMAEFAVDAARCREETETFLRQLQRRGLIERLD